MFSLLYIWYEIAEYNVSPATCTLSLSFGNLHHNSGFYLRKSALQFQVRFHRSLQNAFVTDGIGDFGKTTTLILSPRLNA